MYQPYPSGGKTVEQERPPEPVSVQRAVKLMYVGAAVSTVSLIISLVSFSGTKAAIRKQRPSLTVAQVNQLDTFIIALALISGLLGVALWLWMARAVGRGRNWARILSTALFGLATPGLTGNNGVAQVFCAVLTWLTGLAAVWLLWRPASRAFFRPPGYTQAQHQAQMAEFDHQAQMAELARIRARVPRQA